MNDTSQINSQVLNRDAALNTLMYLGGYYNGVADGTSVNDIVAIARNRIDADINKLLSEGKTQEEIRSKYGDDLRKISILENSVKNDPGRKTGDGSLS